MSNKEHCVLLPFLPWATKAEFDVLYKKIGGNKMHLLCRFKFCEMGLSEVPGILVEIVLDIEVNTPKTPSIVPRLLLGKKIQSFYV